MNDTTKFILIYVPAFFAILHLLVIPILRKISIAVQGGPFTYRLQAGTKSETIRDKAKWDLLWSALAVIMSIAFTLMILEAIEKLPKT